MQQKQAQEKQTQVQQKEQAPAPVVKPAVAAQAPTILDMHNQIKVAAKKETTKEETKLPDAKVSEKVNDFDEALSPEEEWILKMPDSALKRNHGGLNYSNLVQTSK